MREIKFRAWDDVEDKMYYTGEETDIVFYFDDNGIVAEKILGEYETEKLPYLKYMPFTGLYDRKGTPIYEGDLLQHPNGTIAEIKYSDDLAAFVAVYMQNSNTEMDYLDKEIVSKCKIAGNIYENPELLEVEGEMNEVCPICNGSGGIDVLDYSIGEVVTIPCPDCGGSGESADVSRIKLAERAKHYEQVLENMQREIHKAAYEQAKRYKQALEHIQREIHKAIYTPKKHKWNSDFEREFERGKTRGLIQASDIVKEALEKLEGEEWI